MRVGAWLVEEQNMGCGTSRPREMQVIHSPYPWYGGRVAPVLEPDGKAIYNLSSMHRAPRNVDRRG